METEFTKFFNNIKNNTGKMYYNFLGISKKENPKWEGWKILNAYKEKNIDISTIENKTLDVLVENFYYIKFLNRK